MVNIPLFMVLYIPGGDCRISSINSNSHWPNVHHPVLHQVRDFDEVIMATVLFGDASKLLTLQNGFLGCSTPENFSGWNLEITRFKGKSSEPNLHFWGASDEFSRVYSKWCHNKPRWFTSHQTSTFGENCSCSDFQTVCYPGMAAILSWWLKEARYLLWRYSRKPSQTAWVYCYWKKKICWPPEAWYISFSWRNLVYQLSPTSLFFSEERYNLNTRSLHTHTA